MDEMNRREFVIATVGGLGIVAAPHLVSAVRDATDLLRSPQRGMHVRHNVYCLNPTGREIRSYKKAVLVMQSRPATDPTSWAAQAAIHGTTSPIAGMITNQCQHGTRFFLSWHRMFLYYFERIVRQAAGDPAFALPYWGYTPTGDRALPIPFRIPAGPTNPLYVAGRHAAVNAGHPLFPSIVDAGAALAQPSFDSFFSPTLEGTPHGAVHVAVGGWMGFIPTAAQDPIFWLHHANIDRLWDVWIASDSGRADPTDAPWLTTSYEFYDETGARVSLTGADVLDAARQLRYHYAPDACGEGVAHGFDNRALRRLTRRPMDARALAAEDSLGRRPPLPNPPTPAEGQAPVSLGSTPVEARLDIPAEIRRLLAAFPTETNAGRRLFVSLEDIRPEGEAAVFYEIYVNLPAGAKDTVYTSPHYLGNLDFFGAPPLQRRFNLVPAFRRLRQLKAWSDETLRLTFVPRPFTEGEDPTKLLGTRTQAVVGRVALGIE
jgi:tyrosinase-like protein/polyphenol oxidase-like protein